MKVDHLYVLPVLASMDTDGDKKLETLKTAKALFDRHAPKAKTAAMVQFSGFDMTHDVLETQGEDVPLGVADKLASPRKASPLSLSSEKNAVEKKSATTTTTTAATVGLYLVFHSDSGGMVIMPNVLASIVAKVVPETLHAGVTKVSLFACNIADGDEGIPIEKIIGLTGDQVRKDYRIIGSLKLMAQFLPELADRGIRPMVCGYDVPVFVGDGPYKKNKPMFGTRKWAEGKWQKLQPGDDHSLDRYGRKLVIENGRRTSMVTMKDKNTQTPGYRNLHKKVLRLTDEGKIAEALAGWSSRGD